MVDSYVVSLYCGISFLWFKRIIEGEPCGAVGELKLGKV